MNNIQELISELSKDTTVEPYTKGIIRLYLCDKYVSQIRRANESHLVVAALIATVTFTAAFTLPGGYESEHGKNQGTAILSRELAFQSFVTADTTAMVCSMCAVFIFFLMSIERLKMYRNLFEWGSWFTVVAMGAMVIAFVTGTYAVLAPSLWLATIACVISSCFFLLLLTVGITVMSDLVKGRPCWKRKVKSMESWLKSKSFK